MTTETDPPSSGSMYAGALTEAERNARDRFVDEYLEDYDPTAALIRCGYAPNYAKDYGGRFMREPYVLNRIKERQKDLGAKTPEEIHKQRMVAMLYREANDKFSSGSARVGAIAQLSKILGLDAPIKTQQVLPKVGNTDLSKLTDAELEVLEKMMSKANADAAQPS